MHHYNSLQSTICIDAEGEHNSGAIVQSCSGAWVWLIITLAIISCTDLSLYFYTCSANSSKLSLYTSYICSTLYLFKIFGKILIITVHPRLSEPVWSGGCTEDKWIVWITEIILNQHHHYTLSQYSASSLKSRIFTFLLFLSLLCNYRFYSFQICWEHSHTILLHVSKQWRDSIID